MLTVRRLVFCFVILFASLPTFGFDMDNLPAEVQMWKYLMDIVEATDAGDNVKLAALCEKMLALKDEVSVDPVIGFYYAKSLERF